ncbi:MAG: S41 family peptidase [Planctomycetota bacterium]
MPQRRSPRARTPWHLVLMSASLLLLSAAILLKATRASSGNPEDDLYRQTELVGQVLHRVSEDYLIKQDTWELVYKALDELVGSLDPYSDFVRPSDNQRFQEETSGNYVGIGMIIHTSAEPVTVLYPFPGSPAEKAGLRPGDRIVSTNGEPTLELGVEGAQKLIKGPPDTPVTLEVVKAGSGETETLTIIRERIEQPSVVGSRILDPEAGIGYLRVEGFQEATTEEFQHALDRLIDAGARSLVLDLRMNAGGLLDQAVVLANFFIREGVIVKLEGRPPRPSTVREARRRVFRYPDVDLVVLIDQLTASAAEVVAGALQDHKRALLVGTRSFGKGVVQSVIVLKGKDDQDLTLKLTTAHYVTPAGQRIEKIVDHEEDERGGLEPDFEIALGPEETLRKLAYRFEEQRVPPEYRDAVLKLLGREPVAFEDRQLEAALALLRGEPLVRDVTATLERAAQEAAGAAEGAAPGAEESNR